MLGNRTHSITVCSTSSSPTSAPLTNCAIVSLKRSRSNLSKFRRQRRSSALVTLHLSRVRSLLAPFVSGWATRPVLGRFVISLMLGKLTRPIARLEIAVKIWLNSKMVHASIIWVKISLTKFSTTSKSLLWWWRSRSQAATPSSSPTPHVAYRSVIQLHPLRAPMRSQICLWRFMRNAAIATNSTNSLTTASAIKSTIAAVSVKLQIYVSMRRSARAWRSLRSGINLASRTLMREWASLAFATWTIHAICPPLSSASHTPLACPSTSSVATSKAR